ncbi:hypothetical protein [Paraburkholderia diazotrophica]|uniref:Uncharacterized protein n=1 Tax=Paraburkholderia diazotrophica TaxID=667676 RepID=A0A1H6QD14_9BURK|nr:hypothetical protein [Paraburkholderia diazotrophica]SEI41609.1 hypothetical protein SAMN05192539_1001266 [Paraburkholderia diazotrophica]
MKVRHIAARASMLSRRLAAAFEQPFDWHPSYIEGGWDDDERYYDDSWDDFDDACPHGRLYCDNCEICDDEDIYVDTCTGCGRAFGAHAGLASWDRDREGGIAPQLCHRCWREHGYAWPESLTA